MNVSYITMVFPTIAETFACLDVRTLRNLGVSVSVYAIRTVRPWGLDTRYHGVSYRARTRAANRLLAERGLADLALSHSTPRAVLRGLATAVRRPRVFIDLVGWLWSHSWRSPRHLLKSLALIPRCLDILVALEQTQPDVVHLFWGHYPCIVGYLVRRHLPNTVVSMFLGAYDIRRGYAGSGALAPMADVVWTHAHINVPAIERLGVSRVHLRVVHRGINLDSFSGCRVPKVPYRFVTAGRLILWKAMDDVLAVLARIRERWPDASLAVLGDGPERGRLLRLADSLGIGPAVGFRGHVTADEVRREMAAAQVCLFMSVLECLPNVVKEAMASGCACIVAATPGIEELVEDGVSGFVVPQGDVDMAARRVDQLLRNPAAMAAMASAAQERVCAQFDVKRSMRTYQACWTELLEQRRAAGGCA